MTIAFNHRGLSTKACVLWSHHFWRSLLLPTPVHLPQPHSLLHTCWFRSPESSSWWPLRLLSPSHSTRTLIENSAPCWLLFPASLTWLCSSSCLGPFNSTQRHVHIAISMCLLCFWFFLKLSIIIHQKSNSKKAGILTCFFSPLVYPSAWNMAHSSCSVSLTEWTKENWIKGINGHML